MTVESLQSFLDALQSGLAAFLNGEAEVIPAYPNLWRETPLEAPVVAVGLLGARAESSRTFLGMGEDLAEAGSSLPRPERYGQLVEVTVGFTMCCPDHISQCHGLFAKVCDFLLGKGSDPGKNLAPPGGIWCEQMAYEKNAGGFTAKAKAEFAIVVADDACDDGIITDFDLRYTIE